MLALAPLFNEEVDEQARNESLKSEAFQNLENNFEHISRLIGLMRSQQGHIFAPAYEAMGKLKELTGDPATLAVSGLSSWLIDLQAGVEKVKTFAELATFLNDWMLVMLVSFTEAYLEDVLFLLVERNPGWMEDLRLKVSYRELAGTDSLPTNMEVMQRRWQKCWVNNILRESPQQWIKHLERMGVSGYPASLAEEMAALWRRRHDIVHSGAIGHMSMDEFKEALDVIGNFLRPTDRFVVNFSCGHPLP